MKNITLFENFFNEEEFDEEEFDEEEFEEEFEKEFEYVSTSKFINNGNIYISLRETKNGNLKLLDTWTNGWEISNFRSLNNKELNKIKKENMLISYKDKDKDTWTRKAYNNFIKKYPEYTINI